MKRIVAAFLLLFAFAVAGSIPVHAQRITPEENARRSRKEIKKQQKMLKKANKKSQKAMKKAMKKQQKEVKKANRQLKKRQTS